ncbi:hypothetical protein BHE74_00011412, partial [Ensete ventricosum]
AGHWWALPLWPHHGQLTLVALPRAGAAPVASPWASHCKRPCRQAPTTPTGWPQSIVPTGAYRPYGLAAVGRPLCTGPWSQPVAPLQGALAIADRPLAGGQVVAGHPYKSHGRGWPERFYAIQSRHTHFKTNLSHENLGSDTTIGKPQ